MAVLATLRSDLQAALEGTIQQVLATGTPTRAASDYEKWERIPLVNGVASDPDQWPIYQLRVAIIDAAPTTNDDYDIAIMEVHAAYPLQSPVATWTEAVTAARAHDVMTTLSTRSWWDAASGQIDYTEEIESVELERIGDVLELRVRVRARLVP